eukprot:TRINITY_DN22905_c0_g1_i3.p1 TRINITY_DN22905_c0_g1~~TRINITY_DN22905_c0_g1_i3.p1  ORF type:complete len:110 (-),score=17.81 TRINITY_DN22905_c0_g1_i3:938-1267(-)
MLPDKALTNSKKLHQFQTKALMAETFDLGAPLTLVAEGRGAGKKKGRALPSCPVVVTAGEEDRGLGCSRISAQEVLQRSGRSKASSMHRSQRRTRSKKGHDSRCPVCIE